uniref:YDG domain-containing protein n=1 Tax=Setaria viridis TaxID=4556 RepID=A0A4U6U5B8_SETVI|nr:hypothetical protein SEVIR_6G142200v2 [Setaria viridis]
MSFYFDRLEAARRQQRMTAGGAAVGCAPPPRAWPYYYHYQHAALLPRSPTLPVPPLHAGEGGVGHERGGGRRDTWRGGSVPRCEAGPVSAGVGAAWAGGNTVSVGGADGLDGDSVRGVAGSVATAPGREEGGGVGGREEREVRRKKCLVAPTPDARCAPPKRRAVPARRRFPPGCGRDAAAPPLTLRGAGAGGSGALQESGAPPPPLAGGRDRVLFEAAASPSAAAAGSSALNKACAADGAAGATTDGAHHCPGAALEKPSEAPGKNSVATANGVAGPGSGESSKSNCNLVPSVRFLPKPTMVSAYRRFPPGCRRLAAPLPVGGGSSREWSPSSSEAVPSDRDDMEIVAPLCSGAANGASQNEGLEEGEVASEAQESPSATLHDEATACRHGASVEVYASHTSSSEEMIGNAWKCEENKSVGSSCNFVAESLAQGLAKEHLNGETKSVKPPKLIQKPALNTQCRPFAKETEQETEFGRHTTNASEDTDEFTDQAIQDPISADKCHWTKGKDAATVSNYFGPKKKVKDKKYSILEHDDIVKAIAVHEGKFEHEPQDADARSKVKMLCRRFESICRAIVQSAEQRSLKVRRIDLAADKLMRKLPGFTKLGPIVGTVPGVEIGDEFLYRVQLALVGLHRPYQGGIDTTRDDHGVLIAISVVASGGYPDELSCPGELIYTGSGKDGCDQKLEHGNLALRNCVERKVPVRVIQGFKGLNREGGSHSRAKEITTFTYDGLYRVVDCWKEGRPGSKVFKYKLQRIPGQPGLPLHVDKFVRKNNT